MNPLDTIMDKAKWPSFMHAKKDDKMPDFISFDVETTLNGNDEIGLAHPMHPENRAVYFGMSTSGGEAMVWTDADFFSTALLGYVPFATFCGHNISFDMLYLFKVPGCKTVIQNQPIWDTQLAEYIITGQKHKFASLDELCIKYGLPVKDDKIKAYFQAGIGSDKIPKEEIEPYLKGDVESTWKIARAQWEIAKKQGQLTLIYSQMEAMQATTEMMWNGLKIDQATLDAYTVEVVNEFVDIKLKLEDFKVVEDINSPKQWSTYFFGGTKKIRVKEEVGVYKNGNTKYKMVDKTVPITPAIKYVPDPEKVSEKTKQVSVDDSVLNDMLLHTVDGHIIDVIKTLLKYREVNKQLSTYVQGLSKHVLNNFIYGKLNHTATVTGRLSSTSPNLQNISNNPIKKIFVSRWGEGGVIVEVDFNQLEVVALAHITKDKQLIKDISSGVDIHSALYEGLFGRKPTKEERKPFKARTFQLIYGAGAKAISKQAGCSLDEAKRFIDVFYSRYPQVGEWHSGFALLVEKEASYMIGADGLKEKFRTYVHTTETGRRYSFSEYYNDSKWSDRMFSFSPTEMKNYPVQGLATGDIVPMMLGVIFQMLKGRNDVLMVNTIHDSLMFDVKLEAVGDFLIDIQEVLKNTHKYFETTFKKPLALKLNAGASYGANWFEMKEI